MNKDIFNRSTSVNMDDNNTDLAEINKRLLRIQNMLMKIRVQQHSMTGGSETIDMPKAYSSDNVKSYSTTTTEDSSTTTSKKKSKKKKHRSSSSSSSDSESSFTTTSAKKSSTSTSEKKSSTSTSEKRSTSLSETSIKKRKHSSKRHKKR